MHEEWIFFYYVNSGTKGFLLEIAFGILNRNSEKSYTSMLSLQSRPYGFPVASMNKCKCNNIIEIIDLFKLLKGINKM